MDLLNSEGNIVDNATEIIDAYFNYDERPFEMLPVTNFPCTPTALQRKIDKAIAELQLANNRDIIALGAYTPKIYGELSRKISKLDDDFRPFAECIVAFIDQWCINGGALDGKKYGYEICSTARSWFVQQNIITGTEYRENGLSWSLYKKALSINVYQLVEDQISETNGAISYVKKPISFEDKSARVFIENAQEWFGKHKTRTGVNIKIYGVYPTLKEAIRKGSTTLKTEYMSSSETVFWAGLFSTYSNFTSWEYHPKMMPNEVWKLRQEFLNTSFVTDGNQDLVERIEALEPITYEEARQRHALTVSVDKVVNQVKRFIKGTSIPDIIKYLPTPLEIMEEDFISLYNLKVNINTSSTYTVEQLFKWAKANPYSLQQTIMKYRLSADTENSVLFYRLLNEHLNDIAYNDDNIPYLLTSSSFTVEDDGEGNYSLQCYDMFGDVQNYPFDLTYNLPSDYMPDSSDFGLIDLTDVESDTTDGNQDNPLTLIKAVGNEIENTGAVLSVKGSGINEFGPLATIEVDPRKALYNTDSIAEAIFRNKNYNEMITPPNIVETLKSRAILDVTVLGKRLAAELNSKLNEMIQPDKI